MTRGNARELAVHLIYGRAFTGEEPEEVISTRLEKEYYAELGKENEVYSERPSRAQLRYIDSVVTGVANREEELDEQIQKYAIGWDISRISKLARCILRLAIYEIQYVDDRLEGTFVEPSSGTIMPFSLRDLQFLPISGDLSPFTPSEDTFASGDWIITDLR